MRVGWGFDAHPLDGDPPLTLGGVVVSDTVGVSATSDGDVLAHAVTDALLGACVLGDIGQHFPSEDPSLLGVDSMSLLAKAVTMASEGQWEPVHVDVTVVADNDTEQAAIDGLDRALNHLLQLGLTVRVARVPDGKDINEFAQRQGN